jgi:hypothetical protein
VFDDQQTGVLMIKKFAAALLLAVAAGLVIGAAGIASSDDVSALAKPLRAESVAPAGH